MNTPRSARGISLIEVIILIAIAIVLASTAIPRFDKQGVRERVNAALDQASAARQVLMQACMSDPTAVIHGVDEAGYIPPTATNMDALVSDMKVFADCEAGELTVVIWTGSTANSTDPVIEWRTMLSRQAGDEGFEARWDCRILSGQFVDVPPECRKYDRRI